MAVSRIAAVFTYRHQYQVEGAGLNISGGTSQFPLAQLYDKELIPGDRVLTYAFLSGPNADYSGMARAVRENLINRGALPRPAEGRGYAPVPGAVYGRHPGAAHLR